MAHLPCAGRPLHVYAGKEVARALALNSIDAKDLGSAEVKDLSDTQRQHLEAKLQEMIKAGAQRVGQVRSSTTGGRKVAG